MHSTKLFFNYDDHACSKGIQGLVLLNLQEPFHIFIFLLILNGQIILEICTPFST